MISLARLFSLMKREAVLSAAAALALLSMLWMPPDGAYLSYVDWRTMAQLFCLMAVMAGLRELGVFSRLGRQLLCRVRSARQLECVLVFLCFFTSMAITNDVALLTFVPFSLEVLTLAGREERAVPVVVFQTVAANLGSMATPIGNPQNLYLYAQSGQGLGDFLALMLPYTLLSGLMLLLCLLPGRSAPLAGLAPGGAEPSLRRRRTGMYLLLFLASVSSVAKLLPVWLLTAAVVVCVLAARVGGGRPGAPGRAGLRPPGPQAHRLVPAAHLRRIFRLYWKHGPRTRLPLAAGAGHLRPRAGHRRVRQPGHQQRARRLAPLRLHLGVGCPYRGDQPGRAGDPDRLHG